MKMNLSRVAAVTLSSVLLVTVGYQLNYWLRPAVTKAQESVTTVETIGRFRPIKVRDEDMLLDTSTGRVFDFYNGTELRQLTIKACTDADCTNLKGVVDAR